VAHAHGDSSFRRGSHYGLDSWAPSGVLPSKRWERDLRGGVALAGALLRGYVYGQAGRLSSSGGGLRRGGRSAILR